MITKNIHNKKPVCDSVIKLKFGFIIFATAFLSGCILFQKSDVCDSEITICKSEQSNITAIELKDGESHEIEVCACRPWNRSGIIVKEGQVYSFAVKKILLEPWEDKGYKDIDPLIGWKADIKHLIGYFATKRSDKTDWFALVGSIGKNCLTTFAVPQTSKTITTKEFGELYFYANDAEGFYSNNRGLLELIIKRETALIEKFTKD